jgi:hypothetical protein
LRKGKAGKKPYAEFAEAITQAKAKWVAGSVLNISKAATKDWRAAAWLLERRQEEFRPPPHQTELTGRNGGPLEVMTSAKVTLGAKLDEIAKRFGDEPSGASGGESD